MLKKMLLAASALGLVAIPTVASANPYYDSYTGMPHSRSYGSVQVGGGFGAYGSPYGGYYGNPYGGYYGSYGNPYGGYYGNSYGYRHRHRNNTAAGALVGGLIGAVIGGAIANGGHR